MILQHDLNDERKPLAALDHPVPQQLDCYHLFLTMLLSLLAVVSLGCSGMHSQEPGTNVYINVALTGFREEASNSAFVYVIVYSMAYPMLGEPVVTLNGLNDDSMECYLGRCVAQFHNIDLEQPCTIRIANEVGQTACRMSIPKPVRYFSHAEYDTIAFSDTLSWDSDADWFQIRIHSDDYYTGFDTQNRYVPLDILPRSSKTAAISVVPVNGPTPFGGAVTNMSGDFPGYLTAEAYDLSTIILWLSAE